jgi:hypothetical protein
LASWEDYSNSRSEEVRDLYGVTPRFEDDETFLPLQAADFWAWWIRKGYEEDNLEEVLGAHFGTWNGVKPVPGFVISFTEDQIADALISLLRSVVPPERVIYDSKYPESLLTRFRRFFQGL